MQTTTTTTINCTDQGELIAEMKVSLNKDIKFIIKERTVYLMLSFKKEIYFYDVLEINNQSEISNSVSLINKTYKDAVNSFVEGIISLIMSELHKPG